MKNNPNNPLIVERTFQAPVQLVWTALTDATAMRNWYFDLPEFKSVVGYEFEFTVEHEGNRFRHLCRVTEVMPECKLAYTWRYDGQPGDSLVTFELFPEGSKTRLKLTHSGLETFPPLPSYDRKNFLAGWTQLIGTSLLTYLSEQLCPAFVISREFNAPRDVVWKAWTDRDMLVRWFGPKDWTILVANFDLRPDGNFHYCMRTADGKEMWGKWVFREIVPMEKIVFANSFSDKDGQILRPPFPGNWSLQMLSEIQFTEQNGHTTVTLRSFPLDANEAERKNFDDHRSSFKQGWTGTFDKLTEMIAQS